MTTYPTLSLSTTGEYLVLISDTAHYTARSLGDAVRLLDDLRTLVPEGVDFDAWAEHYIAELWPASQLARWDDMDPYEVICEQLDEHDIAAMPFQMLHWHPSGAHFEHCATGGGVVVTDWCDSGYYDIGVYTAEQLGEDGDLDPVVFDRTPIAEVGDFLRRYLAEGGRADQLLTNGPDPLPAPLPSPARLASVYMAQVRRNGPWALANVAGLGAARGGDSACDIRATEHCSLERAWQYHETEIAWEIAEANADDLPADWTEDEGVEEEVWTILDDAATIAIDEARRTFGERPLIEVLS